MQSDTSYSAQGENIADAEGNPDTASKPNLMIIPECCTQDETDCKHVAKKPIKKRFNPI